MKRLLVSRALTEPVMQVLRAEYDVTLRPTTQPMSEDEASAALMGYDAVLPTLGDALTADAIGRVDEPRCKILANFGVGYNHIDVAAATARGITVTNTPGAVTDATADIAMTLILMTARRAGEGERLVRSGNWNGWHPVQMLGMHIGGKTVGIIGMGRIGKAIARRCHHGFGMDVVFHNRSTVADAGVPAKQLGSLADVMAAADVVVLAVPGSAESHHLIDGAALKAMQPHACLVNISRGDVIDEAALIAALQSGQIAGAGLDVYEQEPHVPDALKALDNVVLLPHLGTNAQEVRTNMGMMAVENLRAFFAGRETPNKV
ncbi:2-hydroxyacid dehydrogenase [Profundibacter amoris]|uniref:D-glycerate dehydrogenase n=1 Tax=Profundibacter amoris TaxID=2171755 RepID=A0A347UJ07_9RHOB|nr:D-glycerate dehydrogenase [Profundibacter amoris]AXX98835.1 D-glycerate dehydrogenase [Profundibacter amoris]